MAGARLRIAILPGLRRVDVDGRGGGTLKDIILSFENVPPEGFWFEIKGQKGTETRQFISERRHAHWKEVEDLSGTVYAVCSNCDLAWALNDGDAYDNEMFYCPKCGAKMDEVSV
jgi:hypothetical protein